LKAEIEKDIFERGEFEVLAVTKYDDQKLDVQIEVANKGAYNLQGVHDKIYLSGFDTNIIRQIQTRQGSQLPRRLML